MAIFMARLQAPGLLVCWRNISQLDEAVDAVASITPIVFIIVIVIIDDDILTKYIFLFRCAVIIVEFSSPLF